MHFHRLLHGAINNAGLNAALFATILNLLNSSSLNAQQSKKTTSPIQHVIVIIGENRTFDHIFATYQPPKGQTVWNLLSQGIANIYGTPGPKFSHASQSTASDTNKYQISPGGKTLYQFLPPESTDGSASVPSDTSPLPFATLAAAAAAEPFGLLPSDVRRLTVGASGLPHDVIDTRIPNVTKLPNGPFPLTPAIPYEAYSGSPVHRFYQMWQQFDCNVQHATAQNPSGCLADLFPWVETSVGAGADGKRQPVPFTDQTTHEGSISMGFYNMSKGDAPYLAALSREYTLSDNMHQAFQGGTGANHVMLGSGDAIAYTDGKGNLITPPSNLIENPDPQPGTNNWYERDGYSGGTYSNCSDATQPGVSAVLDYLKSLPYKPNPNCAPNAYYLLNNYAPGYHGDGTVNTSTFAVPPSNLRTIADELLENNISWKYYGEHWNLYLQDPNSHNPLNAYCDICNFVQYSTSIMTNANLRQAQINDLDAFYDDIHKGTLPAVSFVKPSGFVDGHPASSKIDLFEAFTRKIVDAVQKQPLWDSTAIVVTFDEGGGYWDSGYVQPLDFFGDGTRIPLIVVSKYSRGGRVVHDYYDHVSILKFIEKNWGLPPITGRSRDNLPNPIANPNNLYVPTNSPAIGDLWNMFQFSGKN
jgi:phospholipase C